MRIAIASSAYLMLTGIGVMQWSAQAISLSDWVLTVLTAIALAYGVSPIVVLSKQYISSRWKTKQGAVGSHEVQEMINLDRVMWSAVLERIAALKYENLLRYARSPEDCLSTITVFEENKEFIMRRQRGKYTLNGSPRWLHTYVLAGDNHPMRGEYLANVLGVKKTNKRILELKDQSHAPERVRDHEVFKELACNYYGNPKRIDKRPMPENWKEWVIDPSEMERWIQSTLPDGVHPTRRRGTELAMEMLDEEHARWKERTGGV